LGRFHRAATARREDGLRPEGPKGQKRPADVIDNAIRVAKMAEDFPADDGKDKAAQSLGQRGGRARAKSLTKEQGQRLHGKLPAPGGAKGVGLLWVVFQFEN
jgi:hypothetical protein